MKHEVFWKNPGYKPRPELKEDTECDYLIVGGGITGVSLAYFLSQQKNKKIILVEKNTIGSGATGKSAGTLVLKGELDLRAIIKKYGRKRGLEYWKGNHQGLRLIKETIQKEKIDCDYEPLPTLFCGFKGYNYNNLFEEFKVEKEIEQASQFLTEKDLKKHINTELFTHAILSFDHGVSVNPLKFVQNLSKKLNKKVQVYENTNVTHIEKDHAKTHHGKISFKKIILTMDASHPSTKVKNMKSTIIVTSPLTSNQLKQTGLHNKKIIWDSKLDYEYLKVVKVKENRLLVGFGGITVHKKYNRTDPHFPHIKQINNFIKKLFPYLKLKTDYVWSGTFGITDSYVPLVEIKGNQIAIAGAGSQVVCVMAAKHIADKLSGKRSELDYFFNN